RRARVETRRPTNPAAEEILGLYFSVLDHGFVALVDYMGSDEDVERAARVSYGYGTRRTSETRGLVRYLRRHRHTTPSEMVELARIDLPLSTYTQWYWKIDLHNLFHFLSVRVDAHAQLETRAYARVMAGMLKRVAPLSFEAWLDYEYGGAHLSRGELAALRRLVEVRGRDLEARRDARVGASELASLGLSKREVDELLAKLAA